MPYSATVGVGQINNENVVSVLSSYKMGEVFGRSSTDTPSSLHEEWSGRCNIDNSVKLVEGIGKILALAQIHALGFSTLN